MVEFLHALEVHDETAALPVLAKIPTLIACGDHDVLTPPEHSEEMAAVLPQVGAGDRRRRRSPGAAGAARGHQRRAGASGRAGDPEQAGGADAAPAGSGAAPWLTEHAWPAGTATLATRRGHDRAWANSSAGSCGPATWWCCPGPLGAGKTVLAKGIAAAMDVDGPVTSPTLRAGAGASRAAAGRPAMVHVDVYRLLDHAARRSARPNSTRWTSTPISTTPSSWWSGVKGLAERLSEHHLDIRLERADDSEVRIATWRWSRP